MIIQCEGCTSKYFLPQDKMPTSPTKVRCPQCRAVFTLVPQTENVVAGVQEPVLSSAAMSTELPQAMPSASPAPKASSPKKQKSRAGRKEARAQRLARVLVSDILFYNREKRDQALVDGNLMTVLGDEVKKSWELYKDKVGADVAKSTNYFKEALNEILADGQEVF